MGCPSNSLRNCKEVSRCTGGIQAAACEVGNWLLEHCWNGLSFCRQEQKEKDTLEVGKDDSSFSSILPASPKIIWCCTYQLAKEESCNIIPGQKRVTWSQEALNNKWQTSFLSDSTMNGSWILSGVFFSASIWGDHVFCFSFPVHYYINFKCYPNLAFLSQLLGRNLLSCLHIAIYIYIYFAKIFWGVLSSMSMKNCGLILFSFNVLVWF